MAYDTVNFTLAADLAASGTVTVSYPSGRSKGNYSLSTTRHKLIARGSNTYTAPEDFTLTFNANASNITLTWGSGKPTLAAGSRMVLQMERQGKDDGRPNDPANVVKMADCRLWEIDLGSPNVLDADGIAAAQAVAGAGNLTINGALASGGSVTTDVPRGVQIVSSNVGDTTQTATFTGKDEYDVTVKETLTFNGTTPVLGKKAFKKVTQVAISAALVGNGSAGTTDILGLPVFVPSTALIVKELEDGAAAVAGTAVAGVTSKATATTGDVRGTYDPNSATDGSKGFKLVVALADPTFKGVTQFS